MCVVKSGLITHEEIPGQEGNFCSKKYHQPTHLSVSHYSLMVLVGLQGAHTGSERHSQYSCELLARAPGVCIAPAHRTCLVHRCPGFTRNA